LFFCQWLKPRFKTEDRILNTSTDVDDCLSLMRKLIAYRRQKALHHQLMKPAERSMLGVDAIVMLYHCAKVSVGHILEVGSCVGGATIVMAMGVRDSGTEKKIISIGREVPGRPASALQGNFTAFRYFRPASLRKVHGLVAIETKR
jgi:predicted O-methyltransferase YrrM